MAGLLDLSTRLGSGGQHLLAASPSISCTRRPKNPFTVCANAVAPPPFAEETAPPLPILNKYSSRVTQPKSQGGSQAILYGVGLSDDDLRKPQVGISSVWYEGNTCNMHLLKLSEAVKEGVKDAGMVGFRFNTVGVSDAISMGTEGMCYSLQSRDLIADSIETVMGGQWYDANISIPGCDKNMPGTIIAMGRINRPGIMIYGGTIKPGLSEGNSYDIISAFQVYGEYVNGSISDEHRLNVLRNSCPGAGACGGMYTANTMATAIETLGMSLPYRSLVVHTQGSTYVVCSLAGKPLTYSARDPLAGKLFLIHQSCTLLFVVRDPIPSPPPGHRFCFLVVNVCIFLHPCVSSQCNFKKKLLNSTTAMPTFNVCQLNRYLQSSNLSLQDEEYSQLYLQL